MGIQSLTRGPYGSVLAICHLPPSSYTTAVPGVFSEALDAVLQRTSRAFKRKLRSFGVYCNTISLNEVSAQPLVRHCCGCPHTSTFWSTQLTLYTLEVWFYHYSLATAYWHGVLLQHQMRALQVLVLALLAGSFHLAAARHPSRGRSLQRARPESMQVDLTRQQFVQVSHNSTAVALATPCCCTPSGSTRMQQQTVLAHVPHHVPLLPGRFRYSLLARFHTASLALSKQQQYLQVG